MDKYKICAVSSVSDIINLFSKITKILNEVCFLRNISFFYRHCSWGYWVQGTGVILKSRNPLFLDANFYLKFRLKCFRAEALLHCLTIQIAFGLCMGLSYVVVFTIHFPQSEISGMLPKEGVHLPPRVYQWVLSWECYTYTLELVGRLRCPCGHWAWCRDFESHIAYVFDTIAFHANL